MTTQQAFDVWNVKDDLAADTEWAFRLAREEGAGEEELAMLRARADKAKEEAEAAWRIYDEIRPKGEIVSIDVW